MPQMAPMNWLILFVMFLSAAGLVSAKLNYAASLVPQQVESEGRAKKISFPQKI